MNFALLNYTDIGIHEPRGRKIALSLVEKGHKIHWICAEEKGKEKHDGITIHYLPIPKFLPFRIKECLYLLITPIWLLLKQKQLNIQNNIGYSHPGGVAAYFTKKITKINYIFDYPDPLYSIDKHYAKYAKQSPLVTPFWTLFEKMEAAALKHAKKIFTISDFFANYLHSKYNVNKNNIIISANAPNEDLFNPNKIDKKLRKQYPGKKILVYAGKAVEEYGIYSMLGNFAELIKENKQYTLFLIVKCEDDTLQNKIKELNLEKQTKIFTNLPYEQVPTILATAHAAIYPYPPSPINDNALPNKLIEYICCGLPVISTNLPSAKEALPNIGSFYEYNNQNSFKTAVSNLFSRKITPLKKQARKIAITKYSWKNSVLEYEKELGAN